MALRRSRRRHPQPVRTACDDIEMINGTAPWVWVILTPSSGTSGIGIMPFRDLTAVPRGPSGTAVAQVGGNVLVFAALGALPPMRSAELAGLAAIAAVTATGSAGVEALQYMPHLGRVSAIDDTLARRYRGDTGGDGLTPLVGPSDSGWGRSVITARENPERDARHIDTRKRITGPAQLSVRSWSKWGKFSGDAKPGW
jgi:VanZ like family.